MSTNSEPTYVTARRDMARELDRLGITVRVSGGRVQQDQSGWEHRGWLCTIRREGFYAKMHVIYRTGMGIADQPAGADVVASVLNDAEYGSQTFEDFCADSGLSTDSREAERTWKQCRAYAQRWARFEISEAAAQRLREYASEL